MSQDHPLRERMSQDHPLRERLSQVRERFAALDAATSPWRSVYDAMRTAAARDPSKVAVIDIADPAADQAPEQLSYRELMEQVTRTANFFRSLGVRPGDAVFFLAPTTLSSITAFWAAHAAGAVAPANPFLGTPVLAGVAASAGATVIVSGGAGGADGTYDKARELLACVPGLRRHVVADGRAPEGSVDLASAVAAFDGSKLDGAEPELDDIAAYFPTGGTTGAPKIAKLSHRNLLVGMHATAIAGDPAPDHVVPAGLPLFHVGGGVITTTRTIVLGQTLVLLTPAGFRSPGVIARFWELADRYGFTQLITVPTVFGDLLKTYPGTGTTIRRFVAGASKLPLNLCAAYERTFGAGIHEGYGMTECSGFCTVNPVELPPRPGSGGMTAPYYRVRTVRLDGEGRYQRDCATEESGSIAVSGPAVFLGYTDPAQTAAKFIDGMPDENAWIDSGDLGRFDADGYLWVEGRTKDLIIRGGHNIDPAVIEDALLRHPAVADAAAVSMPDPRVGELPVAFVEVSAGASPSESELREHCAGLLHERAATPVRVFVIEALPRTAMRKIFKPELRRMAADVAVQAALSALHPTAPSVRAGVLCDAAGRLSVRLTATADGPPDPDGRLAEALGLLNLDYVVEGPPA